MSLRIEQRGEELVILSDCHNRPVATVKENGLEVRSKHSSDKCENLITWEEIEEAKRRAAIYAHQ
jgi:hypothetical protein